MVLHLGIEEAGVLIHNGDSSVVRLHGEEGIARGDDGGNIQTKLLRMHVGLDPEGQRLLLAGRDLDSILLGGQVAHDTGALRIEVGRPEAAADELDDDGLWLLVREGDEGVGGLAVDELYAEDFGIGEAGGDCDGEGWALCRNDRLICVEL
jgi:hypothetical protein